MLKYPLLALGLLALLLAACAPATPTSQIVPFGPTEEPTTTRGPRLTPTPEPTATLTPVPSSTPDYSYFGGQMIYYIPGVEGIKLDGGKYSDPFRYIQVTAGITPARMELSGKVTDCPGLWDWGIFMFATPEDTGANLTIADYDGYITFVEKNNAGKSLPKSIFYKVVYLSRMTETTRAHDTAVYVDRFGVFIGARQSVSVVETIDPALSQLLIATAKESLAFKGKSFKNLPIRGCYEGSSWASGFALVGHP